VLLINNILDVNLYLFIYMFIYNLSLISFFWLLFTFISTQLKTLYTFSEFTQHPFFVLNVSILLFSMAGVPPFIGFFSKLFIMVLILNNFYFLFYFVFIVLLFLGLYFYIQNIRFIHSTNYKNLITPVLISERVTLPMLYFTNTLLIIITFGLVYTDDLILLFSWIFF